MIKPMCDRCRQELTRPGGLAFSPPPNLDVAGQVIKYHVCATCWQAFLLWLQQHG